MAPPLRELEHPSALHRNVDRLAASPVLVIAATQDEHYRLDEVHWLFPLLSSADKELVIYEGGHSPPADYAGLAAAWFQRFWR